jgi:hypothetical protein
MEKTDQNNGENHAQNRSDDKYMKPFHSNHPFFDLTKSLKNVPYRLPPRKATILTIYMRLSYMRLSVSKKPILHFAAVCQMRLG